MPTALPDARRALAGLLRAARPASAPRIVNLVGPLGVGKSRLLAEVAGPGSGLPRPWIFDGADSESRVRAARRRARRAPAGTVVVVAGRRPLAGRPAWGGEPVAVIELAPWPPQRVRALVAGFGVAGDAALDLAVRLGGGIPLLARAVAGALLSGADPRSPGALADAATDAVLRRLRAEAPALDPAPLCVLATVDGADEELLAALVPPARGGGFDVLARLSVVRADAHGLSVAEPFRTVFDLAYRWRKPGQRRQLAAKAVARRHGQVALTADARLRARIAEQVLFLAARPRLRDDLFAELPGPMRVRPGRAADAGDMGRLTRQWAATEGLDRRGADRMLRRWLDGAEHGFHMLVDGADRPVGMVNLTPLDDGAAPALEPLLQQHAEALAGAGGAVVGMMAVDERHARFQPLLVRQILVQGIARGRLVVSTPWLPYQQMCARFGLRRVGQTRDDLYRCGRANAVYARGFRPAQLPGWLTRLQAPPSDPAAGPDVAAVRTALESLRSGRRAAPPLADRALAAVLALAGSPSPLDREAAAVLSAYYVRGAGGHDLVAHALHLSRATYFRRLRQGLTRVAELLA